MMPPPNESGPVFVPNGNLYQPNEWEARVHEFTHALKELLDYMSTFDALEKIKTFPLFQDQPNIIKVVSQYETFLKSKPNVYDKWLKKFVNFNWIPPEQRKHNMVI